MKRSIRLLSVTLALLLLLTFGATAYATSVDPYVGEIIQVAFTFEPYRYYNAYGTDILISSNTALFSVYGNSFGGDGITAFKLPDLLEYTPDCYNSHYYGTRYCISSSGIFPSIDTGIEDAAISEVKLMPLSRPAGSNWVRCAGQLLPIASYVAAYAAVGTWYGGDGNTTFGVPDLSALEPEGLGYFMCVNGSFPENVERLMGEVYLMAGQYGTINHSLPCQGQTLQISTNTALFSLLGTTYGGNGIQTFMVPNTWDRSNGDNAIINPLPGLQYYICTQGVFPARN